MSDNLNDFYINKPEPNKSCFLALRSIILQQNNSIWETRKYGMPCFCIDKKILCYLWTDKKTNEPYILFVNGNALNHSLLETGTRKKMKILRINPSTSLPLETIQSILNQAIALNQL